MMGGQGSGRNPKIKNKIYTLDGLGQLKLGTIGTLLDKGIMKPVLSEGLRESTKDFDAIIITDKKNEITIRGIKKILTIDGEE